MKLTEEEKIIHRRILDTLEHTADTAHLFAHVRDEKLAHALADFMKAGLRAATRIEEMGIEEQLYEETKH